MQWFQLIVCFGLYLSFGKSSVVKREILAIGLTEQPHNATVLRMYGGRSWYLESQLQLGTSSQEMYQCVPRISTSDHRNHPIAIYWLDTSIMYTDFNTVHEIPESVATVFTVNSNSTNSLHSLNSDVDSIR